MAKKRAILVTGHRGSMGSETLRLSHFPDERLTGKWKMF
jgi:hypothetical protein